MKAVNADGVLVEFSQIETLTNEHGAPVATLTGTAAGALGPQGRIHVSISHEEGTCTAAVLVEDGR